MLPTVLASNSYEIKDVKCYGDLLLQVNSVSGSTNYTIGNCVMYSPLNYNCTCYNSTIIANKPGEYSKITLRLQYYITNTTNDESKRVVTKTFELKTAEKLSIMGEAIDVVSFLIGGFIILVLFGIIVTIIFIFAYKKFMKEDAKTEHIKKLKNEEEVRKLMKNL
jgi:hypothetical protein